MMKFQRIVLGLVLLGLSIPLAQAGDFWVSPVVDSSKEKKATPKERVRQLQQEMAELKKKLEETQKKVEEKTFEAWVCNRPIRVGSMVRKEMLDKVMITPAEAARAQAMKIVDIDGRVCRGRMATGQMVTRPIMTRIYGMDTKIPSPDQDPVFHGRGLTILAQTNGSAKLGLLKPGVKVDVTLTAKGKRDIEPTTQLLFQNLTVLAVSKKKAAQANEKDDVKREQITLACSFEEAMVLIHAQQLGTLSVVVRHPDDNNRVPPKKQIGVRDHHFFPDRNKKDDAVYNAMARVEREMNLMSAWKATRRIMPGQELKADDLQHIELSPFERLTKQPVYIGDIVGHKARVVIEKGDVFTTNMFSAGKSQAPSIATFGRTTIAPTMSMGFSLVDKKVRGRIGDASVVDVTMRLTMETPTGPQEIRKVLISKIEVVRTLQMAKLLGRKVPKEKENRVVVSCTVEQARLIRAARQIGVVSISEHQPTDKAK